MTHSNRTLCVWLMATGGIVGMAASVALAVPRRLPPLPDEDWSIDHAAHLLRRAGFGGTPEQIQHLHRLGLDAAVDLLVNLEETPPNVAPYPAESLDDQPPRGMFAGMDREDRQVLIGIQKTLVGQRQIQSIQDWWLRRMVMTSRPLEEKMTLFLHGLLTSGYREVKSARQMLDQNELLRTHALGNYKELIHAISRDAAMLRYLDNNRNVKSQPNENYARELMELFTLGEGHYTEQDIREAARAFTGWTALPNLRKANSRRDPKDPPGFFVRPFQHDDGEKTFMGRTGNFDGDDIIDIIFQQPAASRHLARELFVFFVHPEPSDATLESLAYEIRRHDFDLRASMRALLRSRVFYEESHRFALIKSPTELMVGTLRMLEVPPGDLRAGNQAIKEMGQELFQPPNVKGWDGGRSWITTSTLYHRYNAMAAILQGSPGRGEKAVMRDRHQAWVLASLGIAVEDVEDRYGPPPQGWVEQRLRMIGMQMQDGEPMMVEGERMTPGKSQISSGEGKTAKSADPQRQRFQKIILAMDRAPDEAKQWLRELSLPPDYTSAQPAYDPQATQEAYRLSTPDQIAEHFVRRLLQTPLPEDRMHELLNVLKGVSAEMTAENRNQRIRDMLLVLMSMPEYQLN